MNWHAIWHGCGAALISAATAAAAYQQAPQGWGMVLFFLGIGISFWKGADAYLRIPDEVK